MARQTILQILNHTKSKLESSKTTAILSQGASDASKKILNSFIEYIGQRRNEYVELVQQSKLPVETANLQLSTLQNVTIFLEEKMKEFEKILFMKQGELINNDSYVTELSAILKSFDEAEAKANEPEAVEPAADSSNLIEENVDADASVKEPFQLRERPDERDTAPARAARDLKNRRKLAAQEKAQAQEPAAETSEVVKSKKGKKSGRRSSKKES